MGYYNNSVYTKTRYAQAMWTPDLTTVMVLDGRLSVGAAFGLMDGYSSLRHGKVFPSILPVVTYGWGRVGFNVAYIPTVKGKLDGVVALQLKVRLY